MLECCSSPLKSVAIAQSWQMNCTKTDALTGDRTRDSNPEGLNPGFVFGLTSHSQGVLGQSRPRPQRPRPSQTEPKHCQGHHRPRSQGQGQPCPRRQGQSREAKADRQRPQAEAKRPRQGRIRIFLRLGQSHKAEAPRSKAASLRREAKARLNQVTRGIHSLPKVTRPKPRG